MLTVAPAEQGVAGRTATATEGYWCGTDGKARSHVSGIPAAIQYKRARRGDAKAGPS